MRIVEIGHTGVGKTTYMAAMYGALQKGIGGFSLRATNPIDHTRLIKLSRHVRRGIYPTPTDQRSEYNFYLQYQGKDVFNFCWADYRGGAIRETQDSDQARLLLRDLKQANGVLMFCDSQALARKNNRSNQIGRMIALISNALQKLDHPLAIAVILTKIDLVDASTLKQMISQYYAELSVFCVGKDLYSPHNLLNIWTIGENPLFLEFQKIFNFSKGSSKSSSDKKPVLDESTLEPFRGLFEAIEASNSITGGIIPVACGIKSINVELPVLFALQIGVSVLVERLRKEMKEYQEMAEYYERQTYGIGGVLRELWDEFQGNETFRQKAQARYQKAQEKYQEIEPIIEPVEALNRYLSPGS